jgi:outer membrane protein
MKHLRILALGWLVVAAFAGTAIAQGDPLSLEQAVSKTLATNHDLLAAQHENKAASFGVAEAAGHYLPSVNLQEIYMESINPVYAFGTDLNQGEFSLMDFQMSDPNEPEKAIDYNTRLTVDQPIFGGGKIITGIYQASKMKVAAGLTERRQRLTAEYEVANAYYNVLRAQRFVSLTDQVIQTMERHVATAGDYYKSGMALESEVLQAQVYLARANVARVEADNNRQLALAQLNFLMGEPQDTPWTLTDPEKLDCTLPPLSELITEALSKRQDLAAMERKVAVASSQKMMAGTGFIPTLGIRAEYNFHDEDKLFGDQAEDWTVMAVASWNLFDGGKDVARIGKSHHESKASKIRLAKMKQGIGLEVRQRVLTLGAAGKKHEMASAAVKQAERNLEIQTNRFEKGLVKIADLLDAQTADTESKTNELDATYAVILSRLAIRHAVGDNQCGPMNNASEETE